MVFFMMGRDMRAMDPHELVYWGTMALAISVGFATAYPINWWLVSKGLKHGLMTVRAAAPAPAAEPAGQRRPSPEPAPTPAGAGHAGHAGGSHPMTAGGGAR
jgi:hypothetical protein